jgi:hypothetical protein
LPPDDSTFQFSEAGVGLSRDLEATTADLYARYVEQYVGGPDGQKRDEADVWRAFKAPLEERSLTALLAPKEIVAPLYSYSFDHAWKNSVWHVYEPVSFDLAEGDSIVDKANRWLGRGMSLRDSRESFEMHLLLGAPSDASRQSDFDRALKILDQLPVPHELVRESDAGSLAERLEREMREHAE